MNFKTIDEIYAANSRVRERFRQVISGIPDELAAKLPVGEKWTIAQVAEHVSLVNDGAVRICRRLLSRGQEAGIDSDGEVAISDGFREKGRELDRLKVTAPERVSPVNNQKLAVSLAKMDESNRQLEELRPLFERHHGAEFTFTHPFLGEICAQEWLALSGAHEERHLRQIERLLKRLEKQNDPGYEEGVITEA